MSVIQIPAYAQSAVDDFRKQGTLGTGAAREAMPEDLARKNDETLSLRFGDAWERDESPFDEAQGVKGVFRQRDLEMRMEGDAQSGVWTREFSDDKPGFIANYYSDRGVDAILVKPDGTAYAAHSDRQNPANSYREYLA